MQRKTRNRILLAVILVGLINFFAYTLSYWILEGDASNGAIVDGRYYLRGHFIRERIGRITEPVERTVWIYSYLHSISIWPTIGLVLISMLALSKPHILATVGWSARRVAGPVIGVSMIIVLLITGWYTVHFINDFREALRLAAAGLSYGVVP